MDPSVLSTLLCFGQVDSCVQGLPKEVQQSKQEDQLQIHNVNVGSSCRYSRHAGTCNLLLPSQQPKELSSGQGAKVEACQMRIQREASQLPSASLAGAVDQALG